MDTQEEITPLDIIQHSSNGVLATDSAGHIRFFNPQAEKILRFSAERHNGRFISDLLPLTGPQVLKCLKTGRPNLGHHIIGKQVDLVINITPISKKGRIIGAVCNFQERGEFEVTAKRLDSYRRLNRQLETIFKASSDGIWVCDGTGRVIDINEASARLNGIEPADVVGKSVAALTENGLFDRSVTMEVLETKRQVTLLQYIPRTESYLLATGTPVFDENGEVFLVVVNERDLTQLNRIREALEQSQMVTEKFKEELAELSLRELKGEEIVAESEEMRQVLRVSLKLARLDASNILLLGESGTGKGLLAKFIHKNSPRQQEPLIQINCAALPETLLEAELFGYERGAFTGAREQGKAGLFELADGGTLFLDEIGDLPLPLQAKLLKYLDDNEVMRLGAVKPRKIKCAIIAATNRNLENQVRKRRFRRDLYYRLNIFTLKIPPLRGRPEDVFELVHHLLRRYNRRYKVEKRIRPEGLQALQNYNFPGNVRELKNLMKKAVVLNDERDIDAAVLESLTAAPAEQEHKGSQDAAALGTLAERVKRFESDILRQTRRRCQNTREMAAALGVSQPTVVRKMKKYGISSQIDANMHQQDLYA
ncbi:MAG: sigma 54-interacting transcriptional regulator [Desulfobacterales bacterium]|nr:sigma 54-interacting transcriptional regulator [Desulfobacterales bacterium]